MVKPTSFREYDARLLFKREINLMGVQALGLARLLRELESSAPERPNMGRHIIPTSLLLMSGIVLTWLSSSADATVIIKTFQFSICVTGAKNPDGCINAGADAHVVVSDEKMETLDSKIGQAASILAIPGKGALSSPSHEDRHQHHHLGQDSQRPGL